MCQARRTIRTSLSHRLISDFFCSRFFATARPGAFGPARQPNVRSALLTWALTTCLDIQCLKLSRWLRWEFYKIFKDLRTRRDPYRTRWWTPAAPSISAAQFILHNVSCPRSTLWHGQFALLCIMQQLQIYQRAYTSLPNVRVHNHHNPFHPLPSSSFPFHHFFPSQFQTTSHSCLLWHAVALSQAPGALTDSFGQPAGSCNTTCTSRLFEIRERHQAT